MVGEIKTVAQLYRHNAGRSHDINEHLPYLAGIARGKTVQELGFRTGRSTSAFLFGGAKRVSVCDTHSCDSAVRSFNSLAPDRFEFLLGSSLDIGCETVDILFIDSYHSSALLTKELERFHAFAREMIVLHDTETYGHRGEDGKTPGLQDVIRKFTKDHPEWGDMLHFSNNNGLTALHRLGSALSAAVEGTPVNKALDLKKVGQKGESWKW